MKLIYNLLLLTCIVLFLKNCKSETPPDGSVRDPAFILMMYDNSIYKNYCPSIDAVLDSGTHTINLEEGEEYWFKLTQEHSYKSFDIGISKSSEQNLTFFNDNCIYTNTITNQRKTFTADEKWTGKYDEEDGFFYYIFYFRKSSSRKLWLAAIKMSSGSGEIKIKIP